MSASVISKAAVRREDVVEAKPSSGVVFFTVPLTPPSVNHYVKHTRNGRHYKTAVARAFMDAVRLFAGKQNLWYDALAVEVVIYLGHGQKGDVDNFGKVTCDSLVYAGVIESDAKITDLTLRKRRDAKNPRTEITIRHLAEVKP